MSESTSIGSTSASKICFSSGDKSRVSDTQVDSVSTQNILRRFHKRRALFNESVCACRVLRKRRARNGKDVAVLIKREFRSNQGATFLRRFHDKCGLGKAGDDAVSLRKTPKRRFHVV